ncbi:MAG TPA: 50S ribosomal protein L22 [Candidatus Saccharimonadales bacterium]|nr:50S ribosomal protein L22 [Candidatus Saccharimonadales bacterium]
MPVQALAKSVKIAPRKVSVVAALVRGRTVAEALTILEHTPRRSAVAVSKVIASAKANADHNHGYKPATLVITEISVTAGPRIKRFKPAARGRALPYQKKSSHIRVVVDGEKRELKKPATEAAKPVEAKAPAATAKPATAKKPAAKKPAAKKVEKVVAKPREEKK